MFPFEKIHKTENASLIMLLFKLNYRILYKLSILSLKLVLAKERLLYIESPDLSGNKKKIYNLRHYLITTQSELLYLELL